MIAPAKPVSVARARIERKDGTREVRYSVQPLRPLELRRRWKAWKHLRMMRAEDRRDGWTS